MNSRIKMGSDESHFNVWLIVRDQVTRQCPQTTTSEEKGELKRIWTEVPLLTSLNALSLGQTGSHFWKCLSLSLSLLYMHTLHEPVSKVKVGHENESEAGLPFLCTPTLLLILWPWLLKLNDPMLIKNPTLLSILPISIMNILKIRMVYFCQAHEH